MLRTEVLNLLGTRDWFLGKQFFHGGEVQGGWFQDDSSAVTFIMPPSDLITTATLKQTLRSGSKYRWSFTGCLLLTSSCAPWFLGCLVKKMKFLPPTCYTYMLLSIFTSVRWCTPMKIHFIGLQYLHWTISLNGREGKIFFKKLFFYFTWCWE